MSSLIEIRKRTAEAAKPDDAHPCRVCQASSPRSALTLQGGLCYPCYRAYCDGGSLALAALQREPQP